MSTTNQGDPTKKDPPMDDKDKDKQETQVKQPGGTGTQNPTGGSGGNPPETRQGTGDDMNSALSSRLEAIKGERKTLRHSLTRSGTLIKEGIIEENEKKVLESLERLQLVFKELDAKQSEFVTLISESEESKVSKYTNEIRDQYIASLKEARGWLRSLEAQASKTTKAEMSCADLISLVTLPKVEIEPFDGDPLKFSSFKALFEENVHLTNLDDAAKLSRLVHYTTGEARRAIEGCVILGTPGYMKARKILQSRFGDSTLITQRIISNLKEGKFVNTDKDLQRFSDELSTAYMTLNQLDELREIEGQQHIYDIFKRLKLNLMYKWRKQVTEYRVVNNKYPPFYKFVDFIKKCAMEANDPIFGNYTAKSTGKTKKASSFSVSTDGASGGGTQRDNPRRDSGGSRGGRGASRGSRGSRAASSSTSVNAINTSTTGGTGGTGKAKPVTVPCYACGAFHRLMYCDKFKELDIKARLDIVKKNDLCENCLYGNHPTPVCKRPGRCNDCGAKHHWLIHVHSADGGSGKAEVKAETKAESSYAGSKGNGGVAVPTVPVVVNGTKEVQALLDTGSTTTFCSQRLVDELSIRGTQIQYKLNTVSASNEPKRCTVVSLNVASKDGNSSMHLNDVHVTEEIIVNVPSVNLHQYDHLQNIGDHRVGVDRVDLLIGQDHAEALIPLEVKKGGEGQPFAVKTMFGWSVNGPIGTNQSVSRRVVSQFMCSSELVSDLGKLWEIESDSFGNEVSMSKEDENVVDLWESTIKLEQGHYILPVPWKPGVLFPNNYFIAANRLKSLLKNIAKRDLTSRYNEEIQKLLDQGYAEKVPSGGSEEAPNKTWYLPHHAVVTEKKPGKVRVVFDCASKFQGESLNDKAFQGPDLINKLINVLLRFREKSIAVMGDVEAMYNQVRIPIADRDALRFLWVDTQGSIVEYRMTTHLFGGIWCAASSTFALRKVVQGSQVDPEVKRVVLNSFYVDDMLDSVDHVDEALKVVFDTQSTLSQGGFNLTKFISSSPEVLNKIPEEHRAKEVKVFSGTVQSKALGIHWDVKDDVFYYKADVKITEKITKRIMLSTVASMYDPLGLVSPIMMSGKLILQEVVKLKQDWDEPVVSSEIQGRWQQWLDSLSKHVHRLKFSRCITFSVPGQYVYELHHFSDASGSAYGACSYVRTIGAGGKIHVALLVSKGRIAPIKQMTIPRLELQAAVISARADVALRKELRLEVSRSYFWTDSEIVLAYLRNESARYHIFVGNRVSQITKVTKVSDWYHVAGKENPADLITRVQDPGTFEINRWIQGPRFLWEPGDVKTPEVGTYDLEGDPEIKKVSVHAINVARMQEHPMEILISKYSSWRKVIRALAYWRRPVLHKLSVMKSDPGSSLSAKELGSSEKALLRYVQSVYFQDEIECLQKKVSLLHSSKIRYLDPTLDP